MITETLFPKRAFPPILLNLPNFKNFSRIALMQAVQKERKIKHAERLFAQIFKQTKVVFKTQFEGDRVAELIKRHLLYKDIA